MILNDRQIQARQDQSPIFTPFHPEKMREVTTETGGMRSILSRGLSSFGYDLSLSDLDFHVFHQPTHETIIVDPKRFETATLSRASIQSDASGDYFVLPPNSYGLGVTRELITVPKDTLMIFIGKSTYARAGVTVNVTPAEPGWLGHLTLEISNHSGLPCRIYANEGICQALLLEGDRPFRDYGEGGKYQSQPQCVVFPKV